MGFPIRRSLDQSSFAAPQGISQRTTSFIASQRQGIHQMLLRHLIALMIHVRRFRDAMCCSPAPSARGARAIRKTGLRLSPKAYFACQMDPARAALRGRLLEGRLRYLPHRIHSLFTISNTRRPLHKEQTRVFLYPRGSLGTAPQISLTFRTAQYRQAPWWSQTGSNRRPHACKARALPTELWPLQDWPQAPAATSVALAFAPWGAAAGRPCLGPRGPRLRGRRENGGPGTTRTSDLTLIRGAL